MNMRAAALALLTLASSSPAASAAELWLNAPSAAALQTALAAPPLSAYKATKSDFNSDWGIDFGGGGAVYIFSGRTPDGGTWRLVVLGLLNAPAPLVATQPYEPGNFTNHVGTRIQPPWVTGYNSHVGIQSIPDTLPGYWARLNWDSSMPYPQFAGVTVTTTSPYKSHY